MNRPQLIKLAQDCLGNERTRQILDRLIEQYPDADIFFGKGDDQDEVLLRIDRDTEITIYGRRLATEPMSIISEDTQW